MLAESLDAEELEDYNYAILTAIAFNNPKQLKNWKWQSSDKAGTVPTNLEARHIEAFKYIGKKAFGVDIDNAKRNPNAAMEFARVTGRKIVFRNPDQFLFDEQVQVLKDFDPHNSVVIDVDYEGNFL